LQFDELVRAPQLSHEEREELRGTGKLPYLAKDGVTSKTYAWVIGQARMYASPIPYRHPSGAITFVDLQKPGVLA
jgi:hypothetical protein